MKKLIHTFLLPLLIISFSACGASNDLNLDDKDEGAKESGLSDSAVSDSIDNEQDVQLTSFESMFKDGPKLAWDDNKMAGYIDINGDWVIEPIFSDARKFSEDLAAVCDAASGKWGYINKEGEWIIDPQYYNACSFLEGTAVVATVDYNSYGLINKDGNFIIDPVNRYVTNDKDGYALVQKEYESSYRFVDENGNEVFEELHNAYLFHDGKAVVQRMTADGDWYFLDEDGNFTRINVVTGDDAFGSCVAYGDYEASHAGYIDFSTDYAIKSLYGDYVMIDGEGNPISPYFDYLYSYSKDYAEAATEDEYGGKKYGFVDKTDYEWIIEPKYWEAGFRGPDYVWVVEEESIGNYKWYILDLDGNVACDFEDHNGIHFLSGQIYSIYPDKREIPVPAAKKTGEDPMDFKFGYANWNYEEVIPFIYEEVRGFPSDMSYSIVKYDGHYGIIDANGNWLIEPRFTSFDIKPY